MAPYDLYADRQWHSAHQSLAGSCAVARTEATRQPGVKFTVQRDGASVATYEVRAGKLAAWVR